MTVRDRRGPGGATGARITRTCRPPASDAQEGIRRI